MQEASSWGVTTNVQSGSSSLFGAKLYEIERGKIVRRLDDAVLQFNARPLWKSLKAVGDASTVCRDDGSTTKGQPWIGSDYTTNAPAAVCAEVSLLPAGVRV